MNDLKSIRTFLQVVRCGSFAGAARQMGSTPTSVTRAVAALERGLGVQLLLRTTRSVSLTAAGEVYALRMTPILEEIDRTTAEISAGGAPASGRIRLTAPMSFGLRVLPSLLAQFRAAHPSIDIQAVLSDEFLDIVGAGYDVAVRISRPPTDKSTIWRKLCLIERVLVADPASPAAEAAHPSDLAREDLLAHSANARLEDWALTGPDAQEHLLKAGAVFSANNGDLLGQMLQRGAGVALLPRFVVQEALQTGRLVQILAEWQAQPLWLMLYYPPYDRLPPSVAAFSQFFEETVTAPGTVSDMLQSADGRERR